MSEGGKNVRVGGWAGLASVSREAMLFCVLVLAGGPWWDAGAAPVPEARDLTIVTYGQDGLTKMATLKVGRVFTEYRRMAFFRIKLLPLLVVQDLRLELTAAAAGGNWPASLQVDFEPWLGRRSSGSEWRNLTVWLPGDSAPRLQAQRVCPPTSADPETLRLEGVTLQTAAGTVTCPRACLQPKKFPGQVTWEADGTAFQWQLFTGQLISEPTQTKHKDIPL